MTHLNQSIVQAFKRAIKENDRRTAEEILNSAIAAKYPPKLTASMQASLDVLALKDPRRIRENHLGPKYKNTEAASRVAIVVHCFYLDIWPEISGRLRAIEVPFDIFVTTTNDRLEQASKIVLIDFPEARIFSASNRGMDILPFLSVIPLLHNERYKIVCKIQTKRGDDELAVAWRDLMLDTLIGSTNNFYSAIQEFEEDQKLVIAGPGALYQSVHKLMLDNQPVINHIIGKTWGEDKMFNDDWGFFAGTMFWSRVEPLLTLSKYFNSSNKEIDCAYKRDGKIEHGLERIFGLLSVVECGHAGLMYPTDKGLSEQRIIKYTQEKGIGLAHIGTVMRALKRLDFDRRLIQDSGIFNPNQYLADCPELMGTDIDLIFHYLTTGAFKNCWPCVDIKPSNSLKKEVKGAMESNDNLNIFTYICQQLRDGRSLDALSLSTRSESETQPRSIP